MTLVIRVQLQWLLISLDHLDGGSDHHIFGHQNHTSHIVLITYPQDPSMFYREQPISHQGILQDQISNLVQGGVEESKLNIT
jgi:hypothetical protein